MMTLFKRIVPLVFFTTLPVIIGVGCNAAHSFGKELQNAGEDIQSGTK